MARGFIIASNTELEIDLHINYWCCTNDNNIVIDFGIMVYNTESFEKLAVFSPFKSAVITDLGGEIYKDKMVDIIFNNKYAINHEKLNNNCYSADDEAGDEFGIYEMRDYSITKEAQHKCGGTIIYINPKPAELTFIKSKKKCYFRFRIKTDFNSAGSTFTRSKTKASFLYSEVEITKRISIRINNRRDISEELDTLLLDTLLGYEAGQCQLCELKSVRLFIITSFKNEVMANPSFAQYSTRELENELWEKYVGNDIKLRGELICHYWKTVSYKNHMHYYFLCELRAKKSNWLIILIYLVVLILLDMLSSFLCQLI